MEMTIPDISKSTPFPSAGPEVPPATLEGWYVLHQSFRVDWPSLKARSTSGANRALEEFQEFLNGWAVPDEEGWSGAYRVAGNGIDLLVIHFRRDLESLIRAAHAIRLTDLGDDLLLDQEYVSLVELGLYSLTRETAKKVDPNDRDAWRAALEAALSDERAKGYVQRRLQPVQPDGMPYVCFYPMDKRRNPTQNWYKLSLEERADLMAAHGAVGRHYAGRISQVISGSMGLADWEWAVTLWAAEPVEFKNIIAEMRYDGASADYAEFGPFVVGKRMGAEGILGLLTTNEG